jgi:ubiquinone/menaquinone biosynthesis C-methylase UbiE
VSRDYLARYIAVAPLSLGLERAIECRMLSKEPLPEPLLDLGCGDGLFASVFYEHPPTVGLDQDLRALTRARSRYRWAVAANAAALPFGDATFSSVLANSVLEHTRSLDAIFHEVARVLMPEGRFVLTVPTPAYQRGLLYSRIARALGWAWGADRYERFVNRVFAHREVRDVAGWIEGLERADLIVTEVHEYLSRATMSLDDLFYPSAAFCRIWERLFGHYFLLPPLRRVSAPILAAILRPLYRQDVSRGGYVLLVAGHRV